MEEQLTEDEQLEAINREIALRKSKKNEEVALQDDTNIDIMSVVKNEENNLLKSDEIINISKKFGEERIKADLSAEASRIREKNITTAENEFLNETRELKLENLKKELNLQHKFNMDNIKKNAKFKQMLAKRKKLVIKYSYLYDCSDNNCIKLKDEEDNEYNAPKDFSFSPFVNIIRQFGRNLSKLDRPILQGLKWTITIGICLGVYFLLKKLGII